MIDEKPRSSTGRAGGGRKSRQPQTKRKERRRQEAAPPEPKVEVGAAPHEPGAFPIVGIGASAGGLEALELFLRNVPKQSGMAFVVIQHLDPTHKGAMVELLQRATAMPVVEVSDRQKVQPDRVYVIPPNKDISILRGVLHLLPQTAPRGLHMPIDHFFRSLATDRQESGIGVVLSGMGSDGTLGLRAIKEKAGAGFVQAPASAKFDSMPRSAIEAGLADVVAPVEELPARILAYHQRAPYRSPPGNAPEDAPEEKQPGNLDKILLLLRAQTGNDFSLYKRSTVQRRIERRMALHQIDRIANYVRYLRENPAEIDLLFKELLIGVTSFFRDPAVWDHLRDDVLPGLLRARSEGPLRAWVPGCSTGEEAYSLAIVFKEAVEKTKLARTVRLQVFATDLDREAIDRARLGNYPTNITADVSAERLRRFFVQEDGGYRVGKDIREMVVFAPQNIIMDPPFTKLNILSCRNLLIYLSQEAQRKLIPLFHYSLSPNGILLLGTAETVGPFSRLFSPLDGKARIYRRVNTAAGMPAIELPAGFASRSAEEAGEAGADLPRAPPPNLQTLAERVISQHFSPAAVLANDKGDILYITGRTGKYLEPAAGRANMNVFSMAREGLRYELSSAISSALRHERPVVARGVKVRSNGEVQAVNLTVQKLSEPRELRGTLMIVFADVAGAPEPHAARKASGRPASPRLTGLEEQLRRAREEAQIVREEMQTSQEELRSTNEELQSTNEELTTSKEEMQSMNEELQTVNHELQSRVDELSRSNNDMKNLLNSTEIATLFLDNELLVRRFTRQTTKLINLIPTDSGRPITDITTDLDYPDLVDDAHEVLQTLVFREKVVPARDGRWFQVRVLPYRTVDNVIDGVVITFSDVTATKKLEASLREQAVQLRRVAEALPGLVWGCSLDGTCDYLSQQWVDYTGVPEKEQLGHRWLDRIHPSDRDRIREEWGSAMQGGAGLSAEIRIRAKDGTYRWFRARSVPVRDERGAVVRWYGTLADVDDLRQARQDSADTVERIRSWIGEASLVLDRDLTVLRHGPVVERMFGHPGNALPGRRLADLVPGAAGAALEERLRTAIREQRDDSFDVQVDRPPYEGLHHALAIPHKEGVTLLFKRGGEPAQVSPRTPEGPDGG